MSPRQELLVLTRLRAVQCWPAQFKAGTDCRACKDMMAYTTSKLKAMDGRAVALAIKDRSLEVEKAEAYLGRKPRRG